jgi:predicted ribosome quality control (RQC) complex YloA/Tae2 family protein
VKRVCRQEKRENLIKKLRTIEESYQGVRKTREAENNDIPEKEELGMGSKRVRQAKDVFDEVLNTDSYEEQVEDLEPQENNEQKAVQEATEKEIEEELAKLKNNKSTGENGIPTEILKYAGGRLKSRVSALI